MALSCVFSDLSAGFWQSRTRGGAAVRVVGFYRCLCNVAIASVLTSQQLKAERECENKM